MWSDNRNHLLDSVLHDSVIVFVSLAIGVPPGQFVMIVVFMQLVESFSHSNVRLWFGRWGERILVSPRFHRQHHSIAYDESTAGAAKGHNFAVLFPVWDLIFGTGHFENEYPKTGIYDQLPEAGSRNYGRGFFAQQWLGLKRMVGLT
jgi:sterol desaturase/sphingolipid hydroxylase (fatty acid hydroxylase superfamily)